MMRFTSQMTSDPLWSKFCVRDNPNSKNIVDGYGCTEESYKNLTA